MDVKKRESNAKQFAKQAAVQIGAGGSAGFVEVCLMHPLDLVKTRLQVQSNIQNVSNRAMHYSGVVDCIRKMYVHEGLTSLWKGILPPICAETPKRAVKFFTFEQYKKLFYFGSPVPTPLTFSLAGLFCGMTEAVLVNPFEVVKVRMQVNTAKGKAIPGTWAVTKKIIKEDGYGLKGLNKGVTATICRNGAFNMVYFGFYHSVKGLLPPQKSEMQEFMRKVGIGFVSGSMASCLNIPFDVAKSRIQGPQPIPGLVKYRTTLGTISTVYKEEGFLALYKGLLPKVLRLGPGGAIMLVVYDYMSGYLAEKLDL